MKTRLFKLFAVFAVLAVLASVIPATAAFASTDHEYRFQGAVQAMPAGGLIGTWKIAGRTVHVSAATQVDQTDGTAKLGAKVIVEGYKLKNGSYNATSIDVLALQPSFR